MIQCDSYHTVHIKEETSTNVLQTEWQEIKNIVFAPCEYYIRDSHTFYNFWFLKFKQLCNMTPLLQDKT